MKIRPHPIRSIDPTKGADFSWDVTRQDYIFVTANRSFPTHKGCQDFPAYPFPNDNILGDDDGAVVGEVNNPYTSNNILSDTDNPSSVADPSDGNTGDYLNFNHAFREFTRLRIKGNWFRISPYFVYSLDLRFDKVANGDWVKDPASKWTLPQPQP